MEYKGIEYRKPVVHLINASGLGVAEYAARTCYDSFDNSENENIKNFNELINEDEEENEQEVEYLKSKISDIDDSALLDNLAWVYHHHSIIEHSSLSFLIKGTSRGVLQEHARHRIQSISVRSTRYTMADVINIFVASYFAKTTELEKTFLELCEKHLQGLLVVDDAEYRELEFKSIWNKLSYHVKMVREEEFLKMAVSKSSLELIDTMTFDPADRGAAEDIFILLKNGKAKRNVGDPFKHIVSDNWSVDMVVTFNLRSLKNYFDLRDSGAAWFQIQWLAQAMKDETPLKYLSLIDKKAKAEKEELAGE